MYMTDRELMQKALEKLEFFAHMKSVSEDTMRLIADLRERMTQPEQEPIITKDGEGMLLHGGWHSLPDGAKLYTTPPQRKPLSDEEIIDIDDEVMKAPRNYCVKFARAIEAKLKEKNT